MAARTLLQLTDEVAARGFNYLLVERRRQFINDALAELSEGFPWPFLEGTYTGTAPVNMGSTAGVNYGRSVQSVSDVTTNTHLPFVERTVLMKNNANLAQTGTPQFWYWQGTMLKTYPVGSGNITVEYLGAVPDMSVDGDVLTAPTQFIALVIDGAVIRGLQDTDNYAEVQAARTDWDRRFAVLMQAYSARQVEPRFIIVTDPNYNS